MFSFRFFEVILKIVFSYVYTVFISRVSLTWMSAWSIVACEMKSNEALGTKIKMSVCLLGGAFDDVAESAQPCTMVLEIVMDILVWICKAPY